MRARLAPSRPASALGVACDSDRSGDQVGFAAYEYPSRTGTLRRYFSSPCSFFAFFCLAGFFSDVSAEP